MIRDRKVLLVTEYEEDFYVLPGDVQEADGSLEECLRREIDEELGTASADYHECNRYQLPSRSKG